MAKSENDVTLRRNYVILPKGNTDNFVMMKYLIGYNTESHQALVLFFTDGRLIKPTQ